jgi:hypothetical protein
MTSEYHKIYYEKNKDTYYKKYHKTYYQENKERILERQTAWNNSNRKGKGRLMAKREAVALGLKKTAKRVAEFKKQLSQLKSEEPV